MNESSSEELRALLKSTEFARGTPLRSNRNEGSSDVPLDELASLISSLDIDLGTPLKGVRNTGSLSYNTPGEKRIGTALPRPPLPPSTPQQLKDIEEYRRGGGVSEMKDQPGTVIKTEDNQAAYQYTVEKQRNIALSASPAAFADRNPRAQYAQKSQRSHGDEWEYTVLKFGSEISLRGRLGKYLTAVPMLQQTAISGAGAQLYSNHSSSRERSNSNMSESGHSTAANGVTGTATATPAPSAIIQAQLAHTQTFILGVEGQGIGEPLDCFVFVNADIREDVSCIKYGMTVALKVPAAKERLLGVREGTKPGFWRNLIGQGEKWVILQGSSRGAEEAGSRGRFVRTGDSILLQAASSDSLLSLYEGSQGLDARLTHRDREGLGGEVWQIDQFAVPSLPAWFNRPYLSGKFLVMTPAARSPVPETEARSFPGAGKGELEITPMPPLHSLAPAVQHALLVRELLLALSGVEGRYVRVAASSSSNVSGANNPGHMLRDLNLVVEADAADRSAASQVALLLPICESAVQLKEFVRVHSRFEFGLVSHSLASAIKLLTREFDQLVAQLEHLLSCNRLSLQKMVYLLQPSKATLRMLERLVRRLRDCSGGRMLDGLHACLLEQGDLRARHLHASLLDSASEPFLKMLSLWLFRGELQDPYKEFMIFEDSSVSKEALQEDFNAQYWEGRYTLRDSHVPQLLRPLASKALIAGKYLNVVRGCVGEVEVDKERDGFTGINGGNSAVHASSGSRASKRRVVLVSGGEGAMGDIELRGTQSNGQTEGILVITLPHERKLKFDLEGSGRNSLARAIEEAHLFSSRALLSLLEGQYNLSSHLRSLSRFFLLENGDFFIQFMDIAEEELRKEAKDVSLPRIQGLLQLAIQTSTLGSDPHRDDLTCSLASHNLIQHLHLIQSAGEEPSSDSNLHHASQGLKGVEALTLDYRVGWPVSLVLSRRAITKYQLLSRLLYFSKHVELRVLTSWQDHQSTKRLDVRSAMGQSYCLRHKMLHFLQNFVYYVTLEVIGPRGHEMQAGLAEARDMDQVLGLHERFLDTCLKQCLLASQDLLKILTKLMTTCLLFADQMKRFVSSSKDVSERTKAEVEASASAAAAVAGPKRRMSIKATPVVISTVGGPSKQHGPKGAQEGKAAQEQYIRQETNHPAFQSMINKFEDTFNTQLREFLERLWTDSHRHHPQLSNLCVRLDYNGFYTGKFAPEDLGGLGFSGY